MCTRARCAGVGEVTERSDYTPAMFEFRDWKTCTACPSGSSFMHFELIGMELCKHVNERAGTHVHALPSQRAPRDGWSALLADYKARARSDTRHTTETDQMLRSFWLQFYKDIVACAHDRRWEQALAACQTLYTDPAPPAELLAADAEHLNALPLPLGVAPLPVTHADFPKAWRARATPGACLKCQLSLKAPRPRGASARAATMGPACCHALCAGCLEDRLAHTLDAERLACHVPSCT
jgi:hypothetical protein